MTIATNTMKNALCATYASKALFASLHSGNPGTTGANEISGTGYARVSCTWSTPTNGVISATVTVTVPAGQTVSFAGLWDASTGGNFQDDGSVVTQAFATSGTYTVNFTFTAN